MGQTIGLASLMGMPSAPSAAVFDYGVGYAGEHSTNITRVPSNEESAWVHSLIGGFALREVGPTVTALVNTNVEYRDYTGDTLNDRLLAFVDATGIWSILPRRFQWTIEDSFREVYVDPRQATIPTNLASTNAVSTGPDLFFAVSPVQTLVVGARYGNVYIEDRDLDNDRYSGTLRWLYQSSPQTTLSFNVERHLINYENEDLNRDLQQNDAFFRFQTRPSRSEFTLDAGTSRIKRERLEPVTGTLARLSWLREITAQSSFQLSAVAGYQNLARELSSFVTDPLALSVTPGVPRSASTDVVSDDVYYSRRGDIRYARRGSTIGIGVVGSYRDLDFETALEDREQTASRLTLDYFLSALTTVGIAGIVRKTEYTDIAREDRDKMINARCSYQFARNAIFAVTASRIERTSTDTTANYEDARVGVEVSYSSGPTFTPDIYGRR